MEFFLNAKGVFNFFLFSNFCIAVVCFASLVSPQEMGFDEAVRGSWIACARRSPRVIVCSHPENYASSSVCVCVCLCTHMCTHMTSCSADIGIDLRVCMCESLEHSGGGVWSRGYVCVCVHHFDCAYGRSSCVWEREGWFGCVCVGGCLFWTQSKERFSPPPSQSLSAWLPGWRDLTRSRSDFIKHWYANEGQRRSRFSHKLDLAMNSGLYGLTPDHPGPSAEEKWKASTFHGFSLWHTYIHTHSLSRWRWGILKDWPTAITSFHCYSSNLLFPSSFFIWLFFSCYSSFCGLKDHTEISPCI